MVITVSDHASRDGVAPARLSQQLENIAKQSGLGKYGIHQVGVMITESGMMSESLRSLFLLFPVGAAMICVLMYAIFRRFSLVGLTLLIALVAISWSVGVTAMAFGELTLLVAAAPLLVLVISTSDTGAHRLCLCY